MMMRRRVNGRGARSIAVIRVMIAAFVVMLAATDPDWIGLRLEGDDALAVGYFGFSLICLLINRFDWLTDFRTSGAMLAVDVAAFTIIPTLIEPVTSGYYAGSMLMAVLAIIFATVRWGNRWGVVAAIVVNLLCLTVCVGLHHTVQQLFGGAVTMLDTAEQLRRITYLALASGLALIGLRHRGSAAADRFDVRPDAEPEAVLSDVLHFASADGTFDTVVLCFDFADDEGCLRGRWSGEDGEQVARSLSCAAHAVVDGNNPILFDMARNRAITCNERGELRMHATRPQADPFLASLGLRQGILVNLKVVRGYGRLVLSSRRDLGWDSLSMAGALGAEIAAGIDRYQYERLHREIDLVRLRKSIARDMHDSVAQSLAGARFWLESLKKMLPADGAARQEVVRLQEVFQVEQDHVRQVIAKLRANELDDKRVDLIEELRTALTNLAESWRIEATLSCGGASVAAPVELALEMHQLLREAVSNAVRHGGATRIEVSVTLAGSDLSLEVRDNGQGLIDAQDAALPRTLRERARSLGGSLAFFRQSGHTCCRLDFPGLIA